MPESALLTALFFGLLLGVKHALDADHVVAVTAIVSRTNSLLRSMLVGMNWGIGHTLTLFTVGLGVLVFKLTIPAKMALSMEFAVGFILVLLGAPIIKQLFVNRAHIHLHRHSDEYHLHTHSHRESSSHGHQHTKRPFLVGMVHGFAGGGALIPLVLSTMSSVVQGLFFLLIFGLGSIIGMMVLTGLISLPFKFATRLSPKLSLWIQGIAGMVSIIFGLLIMWKTGIVGGLFSSII